jgi:hypothetical protein
MDGDGGAERGGGATAAAAQNEGGRGEGQWRMATGDAVEGIK